LLCDFRASRSFGFFAISTIGRAGKRRFFKTFSLLPIQHRRGRRVLTFAKTFSFPFSPLLRRAGAVLLNMEARIFKFPFTLYYNRYSEMPKMDAKKAANLFQDLLRVRRCDRRWLFS